MVPAMATTALDASGIRLVQLFTVTVHYSFGSDRDDPPTLHQAEWLVVADDDVAARAKTLAQFEAEAKIKLVPRRVHFCDVVFFKRNVVL